jgi:hypothetical protein
MQRPPEVTFQWYCHHKPSDNEETRETFGDLVTRLAVNAVQAEARMREEGEIPRKGANEPKEPKDKEETKGKRDREDRAKEKEPEDVSLTETEVASASPSPAKASPTDETDETRRRGR